MANLTDVMRYYIDKMLKEVSGMKVLLVDGETIQIVSTVYSQSEILEQEVYLVERLDIDKGEQLFHLKAVCFLRPTRENVARLRRELRDPRFKEYNLFFSNRIDDMRLQDLADGDTKDMLRQVQEYFGDFIVLDPHLFSVTLPRHHVLMQPFNWDYANCTEAVARMTEGVASLMLSLRRRFQIRYQRGSESCEKLAQALHTLTNTDERELFDFGQRSGEAAPVLLILDRKDDPVSPLLIQWTYQAMLHELLGIDMNRTSLANVPGVKKEYHEVVLSSQQDPFFRSHMYANFGDLGMAVKGLVDEFQRHSNVSQNITTIADMMNFVENFSEFSASQRMTGKHVQLVSELSRIADERNLMQVSSVEQELAASSGLSTAFDACMQLIGDNRLTDMDRVRVVLLFCLRYEREGRSQIAALVSKLQELRVDPALINLVRTMLRHCGADRRVGDLYSDRTLSSRFTSLAKQHLKGVENVYTQHSPLIVNTLEQLARGKLRPTDYPSTDKGSGNVSSKPPKLVVVFIVGGATYEESRAVAELNNSAERHEGWAAGMRFLLGSTTMLNSHTFLKELQLLMESERYQPQ